MNQRKPASILIACIGLASLLARPAPLWADGGPILSDPELWALIDEGQQIAVVDLKEDGTARVDLFVSMADRSGQSHEVTFFVPLGIQASDFRVAEGTSLSFDESFTAPVEAQLRAEARRESDYRYAIRASLLAGTLTAHGAWSWLAVVPYLLFSIRVGGAAPTATFETPSSQVAVYDISAGTDLQALIETAGLDPRVGETLASLRGQQIAVVKLQTQPVAAEKEPAYGSASEGQPGLQLGWRSTLVTYSGEATYTYPLGTGKAWASPIELTRVYVVSPAGLDFTVEFPRLGEDLSGADTSRRGGLAWRIDDAESPAFAVDEAYGEFGHIWRGTYVRSNSEQDLVVTRLAGVSREMERAIRRAGFQRVVRGLSWPVCLLAGLAFWVTAWRTVIRRRLGVPYRWRGWRLYRDSLTWTGVYLATNVAALVLGGVITVGASRVAGPPGLLAGVVCGPLLLLVSLGLGSAYLYAHSQAERLQVTRGRAFGAYALAVLTANVAYLAFALCYGAVAGAL